MPSLCPIASSIEILVIFPFEVGKRKREKKATFGNGYFVTCGYRFWTFFNSFFSLLLLYRFTILSLCCWTQTFWARDVLEVWNSGNKRFIMSNEWWKCINKDDFRKSGVKSKTFFWKIHFLFSIQVSLSKFSIPFPSGIFQRCILLGFFLSQQLNLSFFVFPAIVTIKCSLTTVGTNRLHGGTHWLRHKVIIFVMSN